MARIFQKTILGFLSTAVFFAAFLLAGDVLIAATLGVATALIQFAVRQSMFRRNGALIWASLALVIALTGLTIKGDTAFDGPMSEAQLQGHNAPQTAAHLSKCGCRMPAGMTVAELTAAPVR